MVVYKDSFFLEFLNQLLLPYGAEVMGTNIMPLIDDFYDLNDIDLTIIEQSAAKIFQREDQLCLILPNFQEIKKSLLEDAKRSQLFILQQIWKILFSPSFKAPISSPAERKHERKETSLALKWRPMLDLHFQNASGLNISLGGLGIATSLALPEAGTLIEISAHPSLHGFGVVRWTESPHRTTERKFGVEFIATEKLILGNASSSATQNALNVTRLA